jgi:dienelactone hydrolase
MRRSSPQRPTLAAADVPAPERSVGLVAASALDAVISGPMALLASLTSPRHYALGSAELDDAVRHYTDAGWVADPSGRHPAPTSCPELQVARSMKPEPGVELLQFDSGWWPQEGEPGAKRWTSFAANEAAPVRVLRHPGPARPWLVMIHGQSMGRPGDVKMLRARRLHEDLGINVALPVLPLHGPRSMGLASERLFVSNTYLVNNVMGLAQAVWDVRRLMMWLRASEGAPAVGVLGVSLGSIVVGLLATLEADLACAVAVVPTSDLAAALRDSPPLAGARKLLHLGLHDERSTTVHRVVSPLARPCLVPPGRRFIVAGQVDRIAGTAGAARLWRHWDECSILWRPRGHVTTWRSAPYDRHLCDIMASSGLTAGEHGGQ